MILKFKIMVDPLIDIKIKLLHHVSNNGFLTIECLLMNKLKLFYLFILKHPNILYRYELLHTNDDKYLNI